MADKSKPNTMSPSAHQATSVRKPAPLEQAVDVLFYLNIARKNTLIYPSDHEQVQRSLQKAYETLGQVLKDRSEFSLTVLKSGFMVNHQLLDQKNPAIKELSLAIKQQGIVRISFQNDLQKQELAELLELLTRDPRNLAQASPQTGAQADGETPFTHISLQFVDYSKVRVTEETEIRRKGRAAASETTWRDLVALFTDQALGEERKGSDQVYDPVYLADLMNSKDNDISKTVAQFKGALSKLISRNDPEQGNPNDAAEGLSYFNLLIQELNPKLRQQFLAATFDQLSFQQNQELTVKSMKGLGQEVILQMLHYAKADGKEISPSLLKLIQKIGHLSPVSKEQSTSAQLNLSAFSGDFQKLFNREAYEKYVDTPYNQLLAEASLSPTDLPIEGLVLDLETGLDDKQINAHAALALLQLMAISGDLEGYRDWARQLTLILPELADTGAYECLARILIKVREEQRNQDGEKKKIAALVAKRFSEPDFVSSLVTGIETAKEPYRSADLPLLVMIGEPAILEILDALETAPTRQDVLAKLELLKPFGTAAAREAARRTNDTRPELVSLMLGIVREQGSAEVAQDLRRLLDHGNADVRMETLAVLLKYNNPWGILRLRELLAKPWSAETAQAVNMAGEYKVVDVQPLLINFATRSGTLAADFERRTAALQALGKLGDPACVPELEKIAKRRHLFAKKYLRQLKQVMYESLGGYPFKEVEHLIMMGIKQKDDAIRRICRELLRLHHAKTRKMNDKMKA